MESEIPPLPAAALAGPLSPETETSPTYPGVIMPSTLAGMDLESPGDTGTAMENPELTSGENRGLLYVGDQQAINGLLLDLPCDRQDVSSRYQIITSTPERVQDPEDLEFLRKKGCLSLPAASICQELISRYFHLVHPFIPVIHTSRFFEDFTKPRLEAANLLVLWSVFFAAASFVDAHIIKKAGYASRKDMKLAMYRRAKYIFDSDVEKDKVKVVQSALLLSFFYTDTQDRATAWHAWQWTGTAITLCQTMGLHRDLDAMGPETHFQRDQVSLFRRIWWSCFVCDRWLSLSHGWPMRIQLEFCDTPFPVPEDVYKELHALPNSITEKYFSPDHRTLATLWVNFVRLSKALGNTIQNFYSLQGSLPGLQVVKRCESEILECDTNGAEGGTTDDIVAFHAYDLKMFREASIIALYRPYIQRNSYQSRQPTSQALQALSRTKVKAAAAQINVTLERLVDLDKVKWLKPLSLAAIFPAIQIHLVEMTLPTTPILKTLSAHKFQLCMMVLSELRDNYWGAAVAYRLFEKAQADLHGSSPNQPTGSDVNSDLVGSNHENESTGCTVPTPSSSLLGDCQPDLRDTRKPPLSDSLPDPVDFFSDEFASGLMSNIDEYARSEAANILEPGYGSYKVDMGIDPSQLEFRNPKQADLLGSET
ncbi:Fungal specific transcription factor domain-containing protein [Cladophialophora immunda]|nr:Fungal specific transcription factor domain-containing protein [Cladophialophora immunda]